MLTPHTGLTIPNCSQTDIARGKIVQVAPEVYDKGCVHNQEEAIKVNINGLKYLSCIFHPVGLLMWSLCNYTIMTDVLQTHTHT